MVLGGGGGGVERHKVTAHGQGGAFGRLERPDLLVSPFPPMLPTMLAWPALGCIAWAVSEHSC